MELMQNIMKACEKHSFFQTPRTWEAFNMRMATGFLEMTSELDFTWHLIWSCLTT